MGKEFHWADIIASKVIQDWPQVKKFVCAAGITPSGTIHIGHFREILTTYLIADILREKGKEVRFIYSWDDYDRFRKVPGNIPNQKEFKKYIGMSLSEILKK